MKRFLVVLASAILSCLLLLSVVGCNENGPQEEMPDASSLCKLEEAYAKGWLSQDDLRNIAYYYNGENAEEEFVPSAKDPENLGEETILKIKQAYFNKTSGNSVGATLDDVGIGGYYGTYHGCVVVEIGASCTSGIGGDPIYEPERVIGGVTFYHYTPSLQAWKDIED